MTTTELIHLLERVEFGASGRPREISMSIVGNEPFLSSPEIRIHSTGDGVAGAELCLEII